MRSVPDFKIQDELYTCFALEGRPIEVLAEATSIHVKKSFPMAYLHKYGQGHVFTTVLGHDLRALRARNSSRCFATPSCGSDTRRCPQHRPRSSHPKTDRRREILSGRSRGAGRPIASDRTALKPGEKLLVYADCGREWDKTAASGETISVDGDAYLFPGSRDVFESEPALGLCRVRKPGSSSNRRSSPGKKYKLFISWWDFDNGRRIQSIRLQSKDASRSFPVLEPTALPAYYEKNELAKTYSFDIPWELVKAEGFDCLIELVQGPNAVISEAWLVEVSD